MHPALSIIVFTTSSGAGYGLLFWFALGAASDLLPGNRDAGAVALACSFVLVSAGLLASLFHLGRPERAWRALSQWRSSWLSREGVASLGTYLPAVLFGAAYLTRGGLGGAWTILALLAAAGAAVSVICTAYIYRSLKPVAQWSNSWVPVNFLVLAGMTGALWLAAIAAVFDAGTLPTATLALVTIVVAASVTLGYWAHIARTVGSSTAESATGLGAIGPVRLLESPHTSDNYLLKEMGFRVARRHARRLRWIAAILGFALPFALTLLVLTTGGWLGTVAALLAAIAGTLGVLIARWLFFAEAKHTVTLYYGAPRA